MAVAGAGSMDLGNKNFKATGGHNNKATNSKALKIGGKSYAKKALSLSVGSQGVIVFEEGGKPLGTFAYTDIATWAFIVPKEKSGKPAESGKFTIARAIDKDDKLGPKVLDFTMTKAAGGEICNFMNQMAMSLKQQRKLDRKMAKLSGDAPVATIASKKRDEGYGSDDVASVMKDVGRISESLEDGQLAEKNFEVTLFGKKKPMQLKVGTQGLTLFDESGMKVIENFLYQAMENWTYTDDKKLFVCKLRLEAGQKKQKMMELETPDGAEIQMLMQGHAELIAKAMQEKEEQQAAMAKELEGVYIVTYDHGALVRETPQLDSGEVAVVLKGQHIMIDQVIPNFQGKFKTRMHVKNASVMAQWPLPNMPKLTTGKKEQKKVVVKGWITLKSDQEKFVERVEDEDAESLVELVEEEEPEPEPETEQSVATEGLAAVTEEAAELVAELGDGVTQEAVYQVKQGKNNLEMRVGGMNLTLMNGPKFVASIQYTALEGWEYSNDNIKLRLEAEPGKKKGEVVTYKTSEAAVICALMDQHIARIMDERKKLKMEAADQEAALAAEGSLTGTFKVVRKAVVRVEKEMDSDKASPEHLDEGSTVIVTESAVLEDGKIRLHTEGGWVSLKGGDGRMLKKVSDAVEAQPAPSSTPSTPKKKGDAVADDGMLAFQRELAAITGDTEEAALTVPQMFSVTQATNKKWPKGALDVSVSSVGLAVFSSGKPVTTLVYSSLKTWKYSKSQLTIELSKSKVKAGEPNVLVLRCEEGDAEKISTQMSEFTAQIKLEKDKKKEEKIEGPNGIWKVTSKRSAKLREGFDRETDEVGFINTGEVVQITDAKQNDSGQWRIQIGAVWADDTLETRVGWLNFETKSSQPADDDVVEFSLESPRAEGDTWTSLETLNAAGGPWTSLKTAGGEQLFSRVYDETELPEGALEAPVRSKEESIELLAEAASKEEPQEEETTKTTAEKLREEALAKAKGAAADGNAYAEELASLRSANAELSEKLEAVSNAPEIEALRTELGESKYQLFQAQKVHRDELEQSQRDHEVALEQAEAEARSYALPSADSGDAGHAAWQEREDLLRRDLREKQAELRALRENERTARQEYESERDQAEEKHTRAAAEARDKLEEMERELRVASHASQGADRDSVDRDSRLRTELREQRTALEKQRRSASDDLAKVRSEYRAEVSRAEQERDRTKSRVQGLERDLREAESSLQTSAAQGSADDSKRVAEQTELRRQRRETEEKLLAAQAQARKAEREQAAVERRLAEEERQKQARLAEIEKLTRKCDDLATKLKAAEAEKRASAKRLSQMTSQIQAAEREKQTVERQVKRYEEAAARGSSDAERNAQLLEDAHKATERAERLAQDHKDKMMDMHAGYLEVKSAREAETRQRREAEEKLARAEDAIEELTTQQQSEGVAASDEKASLEDANEAAERRIELLQQQHKAEIAQMQQEFELQKMQERVESQPHGDKTGTLMGRLKQAQEAQMKARAASKAAQEQLEQRARMEKAAREDAIRRAKQEAIKHNELADRRDLEIAQLQRDKAELLERVNAEAQEAREHRARVADLTSENQRMRGEVDSAQTGLREQEDAGSEQLEDVQQEAAAAAARTQSEHDQAMAASQKRIQELEAELESSRSRASNVSQAAHVPQATHGELYETQEQLRIEEARRIRAEALLEDSRAQNLVAKSESKRSARLLEEALRARDDAVRIAQQHELSLSPGGSQSRAHEEEIARLHESHRAQDQQLRDEMNESQRQHEVQLRMQLNEKDAELDRLHAQMLDVQEDHRRTFATHTQQATAAQENTEAQAQQHADGLVSQLRAANSETARLEQILDEERAQAATAKSELSRSALLLEEVSAARDEAGQQAQENESRWRSAMQELEAMRREKEDESRRADEAQRVQEERLRDELNDTQTQLNEQHSAMLERLEETRQLYAEQSEQESQARDKTIAEAQGRVADLEAQLHTVQSQQDAMALSHRDIDGHLQREREVSLAEEAKRREVETQLEHERAEVLAAKSELRRVARLMQEATAGREEASQMAQENESRWQAAVQELETLRREKEDESRRTDEAQRVQEERLRDELNDTKQQLNEQHSAMLERLEETRQLYAEQSEQESQARDKTIAEAQGRVADLEAQLRSRDTDLAGVRDLELQAKALHQKLLSEESLRKYAEVQLEDERAQVVAAKSEARRSARQFHEAAKARDLVGATAEQAELRLRGAADELEQVRAERDELKAQKVGSVDRIQEDMAALEANLRAAEVQLEEERAQLVTARSETRHASARMQEALQARDDSAAVVQQNDVQLKHLAAEVEQLRAEKVRDSRQLEELPRQIERQLREELNQTKAALNKQHEAMLARLEETRKVYAEHSEQSDRVRDRSIAEAQKRVAELEDELAAARAADHEKTEVHMEAEEELRLAHEQMLSEEAKRKRAESVLGEEQGQLAQARAEARQATQAMHSIARERDQASMLAQQNESRWKSLLQEVEQVRAEKERETARLEQLATRLEQRIEALTASTAAERSEMYGVYRTAFDRPSSAAAPFYDGRSTTTTSVASDVGSRRWGSPDRATVSSHRAMSPALSEGMPPERPKRHTRGLSRPEPARRWTPADERSPASLRIPDVGAAEARGARYE